MADIRVKMDYILNAKFLSKENHKFAQLKIITLSLKNL